MPTFHYSPLALEQRVRKRNDGIRRQMLAARDSVSDVTAQRAAVISAAYPTLPNSVVVAAALGEVDPEDPILTVAAEKAAVQQDNRFFSGLKSAVRNSFLGMDWLWEEGIARPFRAAVVSAGDPDVTFGEARDQVGQSRLGIHLRMEQEGAEAPSGTGFIPAGVAEAEYYARSTGELDRIRGFEDFTAQQQQQLALLAQDAPKYKGTPISPGRVFAHTVAEPGTTAYNVASGSVDLLAQVFADPANLLGAAYTKSRKATRMFHGIADDGARKGVVKDTVQSWMSSKEYAPLREFLAQQNKFDEVRRLFPKGTNRNVLLELTDKTDPNDIDNILQGALGTWVREKPVATSVLSTISHGNYTPLTRRLGRLVGGDFGELAGLGPAVRLNLEGTRLGRAFQRMPGRAIDTRNLDSAVDELTDFMDFAGFDEVARNDFATSLARVPDGNYTDAAHVADEVMDHYASILRSEHDLPADMVATLLQPYRQTKAVREQVLAGMADPLTNRQGVRVVVDGDTLDIEGVDLTTLSDWLERGIMLPDPRQMRRAASWTRSKMRDLGVESNRLAGLEPNLATAALDMWYDKLWKPAVLLRGAWTVRVVGEEQVRMAAADLDSTFYHPLSYFSYVMGKKGRKGVMNNELHDSLEWAGTASRSHRGWLNMDMPGGMVEVRKGNKGFEQGWGTALHRAANDPVMSRLARGLTDDEITSLNVPIARRRALAAATPKAQVKMWLRQGDGVEHLDELGLSPAQVDDYVDNAYRILHTVTGGKVDSSGNVVKLGKGDIVQGVGQGQMGTFSFVDLPNDSRIWRREVYKALRPHLETAPDSVLSASPELIRRLGQSGYDNALDWMFDFYMTRPTNRFSRSPTFAQSYWQRVEEMVPFMANETRQGVLDGALASGFKDEWWTRDSIVKALKEQVTEGATGLKLEEVDSIAKTFALARTKELLYDVSRKHNMNDLMRHFGPFAEAFLELTTTWAKLVTRNPRVIRRAQQGVQGAQHSGFFRPSPYGDDEEYFVYPGLGGLVGKLMGGDAPLQALGRVSGLNLIAGSVIPYTGPVTQIPVSLLPDTSNYDWARDLFAPFGTPTFDEPGDILNWAIPAWGKNFMAAIQSNEGEFKRMASANAVQAYQHMLLTGEVDDMDVAEGLEHAGRRGRALSIIRGIAQYVLPTGPNLQFRAQAADGNMHLYVALADAWRELSEKYGGDEVAAFDEFVRTYGLDPTIFAQGRSTAIQRRASTAEAFAWQRDNADLFEPGRFPNTAHYAHPDDPTGGLDFDAWHAQFVDETRTHLTSDQWRQLRNSSLAYIELERQRRKFEAAGYEGERLRTAMSLYRGHLANKYPGFSSNIPGLPKKLSTAEKIEELRTWVNEPRLANSDAGQGVSKYLAMRDQVAALVAKKEGLKTFQSDRTEPYRAYLRGYAAELISDHPDFAGVWGEVLQYDLPPSVQEPSTMDLQP